MPFKSLFFIQVCFLRANEKLKAKTWIPRSFSGLSGFETNLKPFHEHFTNLIARNSEMKNPPTLETKKYTFRNFSGPKIEEAVLQRSLNAWLTKDSKIGMRNRFHSFLQRFIAKTGIPQEGNLHDCHVKKGKLYFGTPES